ncbi:MAG: sigma 54-interacting transcriptional regulator [Deltaproteobacteria bacterium]|jgi:transcriptional regulator with GAF, ATPase, and Fis domain|nr:sigma 54-interacting transcriptional regulator [Deltaproteobacteria bacterium]MBW2533261.1 sigma 54-interacting transcriptional regulator [Deltaproteobacteria bacterium]
MSETPHATADSEFFREATLRICGHLEIHEGLRALVSYLAHHMPADVMYLQRQERPLGAMRIVARATERGGEPMDLLVPLPEEARVKLESVRDAWLGGELPSVIVINRPSDEPVTRNMLRLVGEPLSSALSLPLIVEGKPAGALVVLAEGNDRYTDEHARLFALLKEPAYVAMSNTMEHQEVHRLRDLLAEDNRYLSRELLRRSGDEIVGADFGLREVVELVRRVAPTSSPVLIDGETGVGKEVVANAIHLSSNRRDGPFIAVNCGAIPASLIDSELFGHEPGAFTGALGTKRGRFERAHQGTIFLDEIGEMPLPAQVRLLRVIQNREVERVGGTQRIPVDIRTIAATHRDLEQDVQAGRFRQDLWFRLNVFPIHIPPLRERREDIPALVQHFIERKSRELQLSDRPELAEGAIQALERHSWPGNVRELENVIERALILHRGGALRFDPLAAMATPKAHDGSTEPSDAGVLALDEMVTRHIRRALKVTHGKIHGPGGAAELLDINPNTLRYKMRKLGIPFQRSRRT